VIVVPCCLSVVSQLNTPITIVGVWLTKLSSNLNHLHHRTDRACLTGILVADDGLGNALCLDFVSAELLQLCQSQESALELEGHVRVRHVLVGRADVVE